MELHIKENVRLIEKMAPKGAFSYGRGGWVDCGGKFDYNVNVGYFEGVMRKYGFERVWDVIIIPEKVVGNVNGKEIILYPSKNWGYAGEGDYPKGVQKDSNGRYKVAVGPKVINSSYPDDGKIWDGYDGLEKGIEIKVVIKSTITGKQVIIGCIVDDYKAHTYNKYPNGHKNNSLGNAYFDVENGLLQTGISYPNSWNAGQNSALAPANASGNVIEFAGHEVDFKTGDYTLVKMMVKIRDLKLQQ